MSDSQNLGDKYSGVISVLRFFRRINRIGEIDKFASAPDSDTAIRVLKDLLSWVMHNVQEEEGKTVCYKSEIKNDEVPIYEKLCGKECIKEKSGKKYLVVQCPALPGEDEILDLKKAIENGEVKPELIAALALAKP